MSGRLRPLKWLSSRFRIAFVLGLEDGAHRRIVARSRLEVHEETVAHLFVLVHWDTVHVEGLDGAGLVRWGLPMKRVDRLTNHHRRSLLVESHRRRSLAASTGGSLRDEGILQRAACVLTRVLLVLAVGPAGADRSDFAALVELLDFTGLRTLTLGLNDTALLQTGPADVLLARRDVHDGLAYFHRLVGSDDYPLGERLRQGLHSQLVLVGSLLGHREEDLLFAILLPNRANLGAVAVYSERHCLGRRCLLHGDENWLPAARRASFLRMRYAGRQTVATADDGGFFYSRYRRRRRRRLRRHVLASALHAELGRNCVH